VHDPLTDDYYLLMILLTVVDYLVCFLAEVEFIFNVEIRIQIFLIGLWHKRISEVLLKLAPRLFRSNRYYGLVAIISWLEVLTIFLALVAFIFSAVQQ